MKAEIYARLAELIEECSENVKICVPTDWRDHGWSEEVMRVVNSSMLVNRLLTESHKEEE